MSAEGSISPVLHSPVDHAVRPKGILKNPSFDAGRRPSSPSYEAPPSAPLDPVDAQEITLQNTLQNAGNRRSSSAARRSSASRRQSAAINAQPQDDDPDKMRLKWDEANLYLAEQEAGGRMKITEPKTPYQYGDGGMNEEEDDVAIDPRYVNVDEMEMPPGSRPKKHRESEIPGLELGEPEDESAQNPGIENDRIIRNTSLSRESSKEKHVSVSSGSGQGMEGLVGMPTEEDEEKHRQFEEQRKRHYEMKDIKGLLGHPEDPEDEDEEMGNATNVTNLPNRGINGTR